jgi:hypothetical protein
MGDMIKEEMLNAGISLRTIQNYLPADAKGKPRGVTTTINLEKKIEAVEEQEEEISANSAQNESALAPEPNQETQQDQPQISQRLKEYLESLPESPNPPQQQEEEENYEPATKYEIKPEDYIIADLPNYDWSLLIEIIKYLDDNASKFNELTSKWQRKYEEYAEEKKALKAENERLKEENKKLKLSKAREVTNQVFSKVIEKQIRTQTQRQNKKTDYPPHEAVTQIVQSEGIATRQQWRDYCRAHADLNLPQKANEVYGISWSELLSKASRVAPALSG